MKSSMRGGITPKQKKARIRNFWIFRLSGVEQTMKDFQKYAIADKELNQLASTATAYITALIATIKDKK